MADKLKCSFCGVEIEWEGSDSVRGAMWSCEECGDMCCEKCIVDRCGAANWKKMLDADENIRCPKCFSK